MWNNDNNILVANILIPIIWYDIKKFSFTDEEIQHSIT